MIEATSSVPPGILYFAPSWSKYALWYLQKVHVRRERGMAVGDVEADAAGLLPTTPATASVFMDVGSRWCREFGCTFSILQTQVWGT